MAWITSSPRFPRALLFVGMVYLAFGVFIGANAVSLLVTQHSIDEVIAGKYWYLCSHFFMDRWPFQAAMSGAFVPSSAAPGFCANGASGGLRGIDDRRGRFAVRPRQGILGADVSGIAWATR